MNFLRTRLNKDSSNSSKPSSTNGFKKVITNRRKLSNRSKGGQVSYKGSCLSKKQLDKILKEPDVEVTKIEVNKTEKNKNKRVKVRALIDIKITKKYITSKIDFTKMQLNVAIETNGFL